MAQHVVSVEDMVGALRQWKRDPTGCRDPTIGEIVGALDPHPSVVARDLSVAQLLDMAHRLVEERLPLFAQIEDCFLLQVLPERAWLRHDGSLDWGQISYDLECCVDYDFGDVARFEAMVCVALVALSPADSAVLMIKESSICALACALVALTARDVSLCTRFVHDPSLALGTRRRVTLATLVRRGRTEKEEQAFWTALAFNRTLTSLDLIGEEWYCPSAGGVRHLSMLRSNSTLERLRVGENPGFELISDIDEGRNGGVGGSAGLKYLWVNGLKYDLDVDELLQMLGHLGALEELHLTVKLSRRAGTGTTGHLEGMPMPRASSLKRVHLGCVGPHEPHLLRCLSANGTLEKLSVGYWPWDGEEEGYEALFRLLTPPTATATAPTTVIDGQPLPALPLIKSLQHLCTRREPMHWSEIALGRLLSQPLGEVDALAEVDALEEVDALAGMIVANNILLTLDLGGSCYSAEQWAGPGTSCQHLP